MAGATIQAGRKVWRIGRILTSRGNTMTTITACVGGHCTVLCRYKATGGVTGAAIQARFNMATIFALCESTVVTRGAVIYDTNMVKGAWYKASGLVADTTIIIGRYVQTAFSSGYIAIVA